MNETIILLITTGLVIFLITIALFLFFYERKSIASEDSIPSWINQLPLEARLIHKKERDKKTAPIFTKSWFAEYWHGKRSAYAAWFTWLFTGKLIMIGMVTGFTIYQSDSSQISLIGIKSLLILYSIMAAIILWRCAKNSTQGYKYFARLIAILPLIRLAVSLI